jgi:malonyl-CoA decarboxylase
MGTLKEINDRLGSNRLIYAYIHPQTTAPISVLQIALTTGISCSIQSILHASPCQYHPLLHSVDLRSEVMEKSSFDNQEGASTLPCPTTAIFYSINSPIPGLSGINVGSKMIKSGLKELQKQYPTLTQFSTLSPIPSFRSWLKSIDENSIAQYATQLRAWMGEEAWEHVNSKYGSFSRCIQYLDQAKWLQDSGERKVVGPLLHRICSLYVDFNFSTVCYQICIQLRKKQLFKGNF